MRRIKSTDNMSTERRFRSALLQTGATGWRVQPKRIAGRPDIAFPRDKVAVFLDGCFWHGCSEHFRPPKTNTRRWMKKIFDNRRRDAANLEKLVADGWKVFRVWEHDIADTDTLKGIALRVARAADTPDGPSEDCSMIYAGEAKYHGPAV